jgi:hypothetical protein
LFDNIDNKPGQMAFRQPVLKRRRKEVGGVPVTIDEINFHCVKLLMLLALKMNDYSILHMILHGNSRI